MKALTIFLLAQALPVFASPVAINDAFKHGEVSFPTATETTERVPGPYDLVVYTPPITKDVAIRARGDIGELLPRGFFLLTVVALGFGGFSLPSGITLLTGLYSLAKAAFNIWKDCHGGFSGDCLFSVLDVVFGAFVGGYKLYKGLPSNSKRSVPQIEGYESYGFHDHIFRPTASGHAMRSVAHIPVVKDSLSQSSIQTNNNGTWERHATVFIGDQETHHVMYRRCHEDDLGHENDGSYHHYRVQPSPNHPMYKHMQGKNKNGKRDDPDRGNVDGVVADYIWKHNNKEVWNTFHNAPNAGNVLGSTTANWLEKDGSIASCAVPMEEIGTHGGSSRIQGDHGVVAFGWNNKAFDYKGNLGNWVNGCGTA